MGHQAKKPVLNAALIARAKQLGHNDAVSLLNQTPQEEKAAHKKLTSVAEAQVKRKAG
jgi:ferritin-like metal-binding protein YciE